MSEEKRAELYTSPGGRFIRADTLPRILAHWRSLRRTEVEKHNLVRQVNHTSSIGGSIMKQLRRALAVCAVFSFPQLAAARTGPQLHRGSSRRARLHWSSETTPINN
jgi:hypothetical protein